LTRDDDATWPTDDEAVTAEEQREGRSLDARLAEETRDRDALEERPVGEIVEEDRPDSEPELVSELATPSDDVTESDENTAGFAADTGGDIEETSPSAEELAVSVRDEAPGGTDDESDDYVEGEGSART
jgi:hypothetical protein